MPAKLFRRIDSVDSHTHARLHSLLVVRGKQYGEKWNFQCAHAECVKRLPLEGIIKHSRSVLDSYLHTSTFIRFTNVSLLSAEMKWKHVREHELTILSTEQ